MNAKRKEPPGMRWETPRERTAIRRPQKPSRGVRYLLDLDPRLQRDTSILDYGCGYGYDVGHLLENGYHYARGWDPFYRPDTTPTILVPTEVVLLSNVINVIENPKQRRDVLKYAFELAEQMLIVTASGHGKGDPYRDGVLTRIGTFQKPYTPAEFRTYVTSVLGKTGSITFPEANMAVVMR